MAGDERQLVEAPALEQLKGLGWQHLGDASDAVMQQVERWWDKYGVSLAQIDAEVKEAEAVMHGYLKELGYE